MMAAAPVDAAAPAAATTSAASPLYLEAPGAHPRPWEVHKFGGASLATADLYKQCSDLLVAESRRTLESGSAPACTPTMAIVSARGGVTDRLVEVVEASRTSIDEAERLLKLVAAEQLEVVAELSDAAHVATVGAAFERDVSDIIGLLRAFSTLKAVPDSAAGAISGYGEIWSAMTMHAYLDASGIPAAWIDAREVLIVQESGGAGLGEKGSTNVMGTDPLWEASEARLTEWFASAERAALRKTDLAAAAPVVVVTGFVASTLDGAPTTLKRSGSDYSATIFAKLMGASRITMWKNVNGVYTADPRRVPEAFPIESLKFDEAVELAYFGAQVLHPSAMKPLIESDIPLYVRNFENPAHPGTVISGRACSLANSAEAWVSEIKDASIELRKASCQVRLSPDESPIRGITSVDSVALLNLQGTGIMDAVEMSSRLFGILRQERVPVIMVSQASAESSLCVAIQESDAERALAVVEGEFDNDMRAGRIAGASIEYDKSIVAIVGEGMAFRPGTGATFTKAMANAGVNIRAIAQGSSERQISLVVEREDSTKALRSAHAALALSNTQVSVVVIGAMGEGPARGGTPGPANELLELLESTGHLVTNSDSPSALGGARNPPKKTALDGLSVDLKVVALASEAETIRSYDGIEVTRDGLWRAAREGALAKNDVYDGVGHVSSSAECLDTLTRHLVNDFNGNRVIVDCSESQQVAAYYPRWLSLGMHIVSSNKASNAGSAASFRAAVETQRAANAQWFYECTGPGSGLPVLSTLRDMQQSGDTIRRVDGTFSGTLSYIMSETSRGVPFSTAVRVAYERGFTEVDPIEDLSGLDVAKKMVILSRETAGIDDLESVDDVQCESLLPAELEGWAPDAAGAPLAEQLEAALKPYDAAFAERVAAAQADGMELAYVGVLDKETGIAELKLERRPRDDPLARSQGCNNVIAIYSERYGRHPFVIQGPAAGPMLKANGLFTDLLRLSRTLAEWNIPKIV